MSGPTCDCGSCVEMRNHRAKDPTLRVSALEQWHNFGVAQRELGAAILGLPPLMWLARWMDRHPKQAVTVAVVLTLGFCSVLAFVEPVSPRR